MGCRARLRFTGVRACANVRACACARARGSTPALEGADGIGILRELLCRRAEHVAHRPRLRRRHRTRNHHLRACVCVHTFEHSKVIAYIHARAHAHAHVQAHTHRCRRTGKHLPPATGRLGTRGAVPAGRGGWRPGGQAGAGLAVGGARDTGHACFLAGAARTGPLEFNARKPPTGRMVSHAGSRARTSRWPQQRALTPAPPDTLDTHRPPPTHAEHAGTSCKLQSATSTTARRRTVPESERRRAT